MATWVTGTLFGGLAPLGRIVVVGALSYVALLAMIRLVGQRPLGRMQTFDVIVAVAIGSTYGRLLTAQEVQFSEACTAFVVLLGLHYGLSRLIYHFPRLGRRLETQPILVYYRGRRLEAAMRRIRMTDDELLAVARRRGLRSLDEAEAIVLESDGTFSVITVQGEEAAGTLTGILEGGTQRPTL